VTFSTGSLCEERKNLNLDKTKKVGQIWRTLESGIVVPEGMFSDRSVRSKKTLLEIKERAQAIESIYNDAGIRMPTNSSLGELVRNAKILSDNWLLDKQDKTNHQMLFLGIHLDRIADAILPLRTVPEKEQYLKDLLSGSLNFFERKRSMAKNVFWELELWSKLRRRTEKVFLHEPPDIVVKYGESRIGIACKKLYSERHVQNVLSQAVGQIENEFEFGIVAINIDDLLPEDAVLKMHSSTAVGERLNQVNSDFIRKHERHLTKYLSAGRILSAIVSCSILTDVESERPRFRNSYQWTVWTIPGLSAKQKKQIDFFYETVMQ